MEGHFARQCENQKTEEEPQVEGELHNWHVPGQNDAYLLANVNGRNRFCLLDTGSEVTLIPDEAARCLKVTPSQQRLVAANGIPIKITGQTIITIQLGDQRLTTCLVSPNVGEVMLGLGWLKQHACVWDFQSNHICINGISYHLQRNKPSGWCTRISVQEEVVVPPRSQQDVIAMTVYDNFRAGGNDWATNNSLIMEGVSLARAVIPDKPNDICVRLLNTSHAPVTIQKGTDLGMLEKVGILDLEAVEGGIRTLPDLILKGLTDPIAKEVTEGEKEQLVTLLNRYSDIFSLSEYDLGCTDLVEHEINTGNNKPVRQALRRQPISVEKAIGDQLKVMLEQNIIEPSQSAWASNVVAVKKKDGTLRFCVDLRQVNEKQVRDSYPLPRIDACLDALSGATWFTTLDMRSGYHQIRLKPEDAEKTTFITRRGAFKFRVLPFGLSNGPSAFQRVMDIVLSGLNYLTCLAYLDDIIVFSQDLGSHLERLEELFRRLRKANLKLKPSKCSFLQRKVTFLGHLVSGEGIEADPEKITAVKDWPIPTKLREVRVFLGLAGYYRRFVPSFSHIAAPLHGLTKKNQKFIWDSACQETFDDLKGRLTTAPILALPRDSGKFYLDTDASEHGIGVVLSQDQDGQEVVICPASRVYHNPERNYCVTRKELLAVVHFLKYFKQYLLGREFVVRTDHSALQWLRKTPEPIGQQGRWLEILEEYNFEIQHRPGSKHNNADGLSRRPCRQCGQCKPAQDDGNLTNRAVHVNPVTPACADWTPAALAQTQAVDEDIGRIYHLKKTLNELSDPKTLIAEDPNTKIYCTHWDRLSLKKDVMYRQWLTFGEGPPKWQLLAPIDMRKEIIRQAHEGFTGGHLGLRRTLAQVKKRAYWHGWTRVVETFLKRCVACAKYKRGKPTSQGKLQEMKVGGPWERLGIDVTGSHPRSRNGFCYMLTVIDYFSKWADAYPMRNQEAGTIAKLLVEKVFSYQGVPIQILTDRGTNFESHLFKALCEKLDIDKVRSTAFKPSTNGLVERLHHTLNSMLAKVIAGNQRDWDEHVPYVMAAYRATPQDSTGFSPNMLLMGREVRIPLDVLIGEPEEEGRPLGTCEFVIERAEHMRAAYQLARLNLGKAAERQKKYYDLRVRPKEYQEGDWVWVFQPRRQKGLSPKWHNFFTGPFRIIQYLGPVNLKVQKSPRSKPLVVHVDKVKKCYTPPPEEWREIDTMLDVVESLTLPLEEEQTGGSDMRPVRPR